MCNDVFRSLVTWEFSRLLRPVDAWDPPPDWPPPTAAVAAQGAPAPVPRHAPASWPVPTWSHLTWRGPAGKGWKGLERIGKATKSSG